MQVFERYKRDVEVTKTRMVPETYTEVEEEPVMVLELTHKDIRNLSDAVREGVGLNIGKKRTSVLDGMKVMKDIVANWNSGDDEWPSV